MRTAASAMSGARAAESAPRTVAEELVLPALADDDERARARTRGRVGFRTLAGLCGAPYDAPVALDGVEGGFEPTLDDIIRQAVVHSVVDLNLPHHRRGCSTRPARQFAWGVVRRNGGAR